MTFLHVCVCARSDRLSDASCASMKVADVFDQAGQAIWIGETINMPEFRDAYILIETATFAL